MLPAMQLKTPKKTAMLTAKHEELEYYPVVAWFYLERVLFP